MIATFASPVTHLRTMNHWHGKRVLIVGAARQGTALAAYLTRQGAAVVINDRRTPQEIPEARARLADAPVEWAFGGHPLELLEGVDLVCPSGGVPLDLPLIAEARRRGIPLSNDSQIFLETAPCPVIGITGSAGKTTTTTLVGRIMQQHIRQPAAVFVGGNIGNPLIAELEQMTPGDLAVMELSSFQLDIMTRSPQVAALLNLTPNHLDRHHTMQAYTAAKAHILDFQGPEDTAILNRDDPGAWGLRSHVRGRLLTFGRQPLRKPLPLPWAGDVFVNREAVTLWDGQTETVVMPRSEVLLRGEHNLMNVLAACAIAFASGASPEAMRAGVRGFRGVAHRLEFVRRLRGVDWYNDSIATAPERAMAGIRSFDEPLVLLAGGRDKDLPWDDFVDLVCERVDHLIVFGETAGMIERKVRRKRAQRPYTLERCRGLRDAVQAAGRTASAGDVVLLSPGGASFDEFRDFAERGERFKQWVMALE